MAPKAGLGHTRSAFFFSRSGITSAARAQGAGYDIDPDGRHLLMIEELENPRLADEVVVVRNFDEELTRLFPDR